MNIVRFFTGIFLFSLFLPAPLPAQEEVNLGFLIPDRHTLAARHGAELAVLEANKRGGCCGKMFHLIVRSVEGPWGTGSKQAVSMIFDYDVMAIAASLDGRNAHLAEQITTKTKVAFLSTWSTDMTLSYAFVPWFFRCIPDDRQQAATLINEVYRKRKIRDIVLIGEDNYDAEYAMTTFVKMAGNTDLPSPRKIIVRSTPDKELLLNAAMIPEAGAYILFGTPALAASFLEAYRAKGLKGAVFGTISLLDDRQAHTQDWSVLQDVTVVSPGPFSSVKGKAFKAKFLEEYGYEPGPAAAYAFDGVSVVIEAIRKTGTNRNRIIGYLSGIRYEGVTGEIRFDEKGNRAGDAELMIIRDGHPAPCPTQ